MPTSPEDMGVLLAIRERDPDGWQHKEPTEQDYATFRGWVISTYGEATWQDYNGNWDGGTNE